MFWQQYFSEVLGLRQVLVPTNQILDQTTEVKSLKTEKILFVAEPCSGANVGLLQMPIFQKILLAMKLEFGEFAVWEIAQDELFLREQLIPAEIVVISFSSELSKGLKRIRPHLLTIEADHPELLEKKPELKKAVWEKLKEALRQAGLSHRLS